MRAKTGSGTGMHLDCSWVRFGRNGPGRTCADLNVVEIRRLLRTDMSLPAIAESVHVSLPTLRSFIKRRQLCRDLAERRNFITLQRSLARLDKEETI
jgi:hypothetical protein